MLSRFVFDKSLLPSCLIVTPVTEISRIFMNRFLMSLDITLSCSLIVTLVTRISYTFVDRLLMGLKMGLLCSVLPGSHTCYKNILYLHEEIYCVS